MASSQEQDVLKNMIMTFRVSELQMLLGFAGRNKNGKKHELQARALDLVKIRSTPMQAKIRELYKASQESQAAEMMGPNGQPINPYSGIHYNNMAAMMGLGGAYAAGITQQALQSRNPYAAGTAAAYPAMGQAGALGQPGLYAPGFPVNQPAARGPVRPTAKPVILPFYDKHGDLVEPVTLMSQSGNRFQEAQYQFVLTPSQATDIASTRDIQIGSRLDYIYQIQLRFFPYNEQNKDMADEFPPSIVVHVNGKQVQLPNPIPTNKPGVEPKRPPKPVNITPLCKLSPILPNTVNVKWAAEYNKTWVIGIWLVMKLTSDDLLSRLKKKGTRDSEYTKSLIIEKLNDNDADVATTSLKVTVSCPLGKSRMKMPCRPQTCSHLQCFDASTFLQMNERKPTWNCPVCDSKANYSDLLIDGYFQEVLASKDLPEDENEIILESDGTWKPVPKDENDEAAKQKAAKEKAEEKEVDCIDLSDDDDIPLPPTTASLPPLPPQPPSLPVAMPPLPPSGGQAAEIECIDLD